MFGQQCSQYRRRTNSATNSQLRPQPLHCPAHSHLGCVLAYSQRCAEIAHRLPPEEPKQESLAVRVVQLIQCLVQFWGDVFPNGIFMCVGFHNNGLLFTVASANFRSPSVNCDIDRDAVKPGCQFGSALHIGWCFSEPNENNLCYILGQGGVGETSFGHRINQASIMAH